MAAAGKKHSHDRQEKHPQGPPKKHPHIIPARDRDRGVVVDAVCRIVDLERILVERGQSEWTSRTRLCGLLLLQDFLLRSLKRGRVTVSLACSHGYVGPFKRPKSADTIREPLAVLCDTGIWRKVQPAVNCHIKTSASYCLADEYAERRTVKLRIDSPTGQRKRLADAGARRERRLNTLHRWRAQLIVDQQKLGFLPDALIAATHLLQTSKGAATIRALKAVVEGLHLAPSVGVTGTIFGSINGIPKELKSCLLIGNLPLVECDISHAHHCFLPRLLRDRIDHCGDDPSRREYVEDCQQELTALIAFLSDGDYYRKWCDNPQSGRERDKVKRDTTILLNLRNEQAERIPLYRRMREKFPCVFRVIEDLKGDNHRTISKQLQRFTADVIKDSLLRAQAPEISALPDTDALHVPEPHREVVCRIIGEEMFGATGGVCCKVGGIRYSPSE